MAAQVTLCSTNHYLGFATLGPGDCVIARDMWGSGDELNDVAQVWVMPR